MGKIIAIANQKGGVGKTTTTVNLAAALSMIQKETLLIDMDPQGNATTGSGVNKFELEHSLYDLLVDDASIHRVITQTNVGYDLLPSDSDLTSAEAELITTPGREMKLKRALSLIRSHYDYILIDCPPALNLLTLNALTAADSVMIPMQCEYYALEGLASLLQTMEGIRQALNPTLEIDGLLRTMYDARNGLTNQVSKQLLDRFPQKMYRTVIPRNVRLAEAPSHGLPAVRYDKRSKGSMAYLALAGELFKRHREIVETVPVAASISSEVVGLVAAEQQSTVSKSENTPVLDGEEMVVAEPTVVNEQKITAVNEHQVAAVSGSINTAAMLQNR